MNEEGRLLYEEYLQESKAAHFEVEFRDKLEEDCAESMYRATYPNVDRLIHVGHYNSAKDHYLKWGHRLESVNYFCPSQCFNSSSAKTCAVCDKEAVYLQNYPDVKEAVENGLFQSGLQHFQFRSACAFSSSRMGERLPNI